MDFDDSPDEAALRAEARRWLESNAERREPGGRATVSLFDSHESGEEALWVEACRSWQRTKFDGGWAAVSWPRAWGGRDGSTMHQIVFNQEESHFDVATGAFGITLGMIAPTLATHGTDEQRSHVPRMLGGEELWCQLFSEPGAGSDLAGLRTNAVRDGDEWVVNGQKVWTSGAHYADWGYLLARTDFQVPKHRGLTAFLLPMDTPGVTVRPLRQMTGGANFNEVFFEDVRIPDSQRLDSEGSGWRVALTTLMNERFSAGEMGGGGELVTALQALAVEVGVQHDPVVRQQLARLHVYAEVMRFTSYRSLTALSKGATPGPEGSISKLAATRLLRGCADLGAAIRGPHGMLAGEWASLVCGAPGMRLGGGTDEVMRNIIAERVLGLPGEPRLDKEAPFATAGSQLDSR